MDKFQVYLGILSVTPGVNTNQISIGRGGAVVDMYMFGMALHISIPYHIEGAAIRGAVKEAYTEFLDANLDHNNQYPLEDEIS